MLKILLANYEKQSIVVVVPLVTLLESKMSINNRLKVGTFVVLMCVYVVWIRKITVVLMSLIFE